VTEQCVVHHELGDENPPLTFRFTVTTLCREFVEQVALLLPCSADRLSVYYDRRSLLGSVDKVVASDERCKVTSEYVDILKSVTIVCV